jgi:mono/diheme cytochrome c family protein
MKRAARVAGIAALGAALAACDESQVLHSPDLQLDRMQEQPRVDAFDEGASAPPPFTIARGHGPDRERPRVTRALVEAGRGAFERTCAACHGVRGDGESVVARKMSMRPPPSFLEERVRALSDRQVAEVVERGYGLMPPYAGSLTYAERWGVVAYVRALQTAQGVDVASLPASMRAELAREAP